MTPENLQKLATFYVVKTKDGYYSRMPSIFTRGISEAQRYGTVNQALRTNAGRYTSFDLSVVRVVETPGAETRRALGETESAKEGETVKYAVWFDAPKSYGTDRFWHRGKTPYETINDLPDAELFATQTAAILAIVAQETLGPSTTIRRVAVSPGAPTLTETILS